jgi:hypothetical protein
VERRRRAALLVEQPARAHERMAGERQLERRGEDA